jgi:carbon-monoxide dehydrogenase large subunit
MTLQAVAMRTVGVYTNTTQVDAYRGAGATGAIYVLNAARSRGPQEMGVDPWALHSTISSRPVPYISATGQLTHDGKVICRGTSASAYGRSATGLLRRAASAAAGKNYARSACVITIESILEASPIGNRVISIHR